MWLPPAVSVSWIISAITGIGPAKIKAVLDPELHSFFKLWKSLEPHSLDFDLTSNLNFNFLQIITSGSHISYLDQQRCAV